MDAQGYIEALSVAIYKASDEQVRKLSDLSIQSILAILCKGKYYEQSIYWYHRTNTIVEYNEIHLQQLLNLLMQKPLENTTLSESIIAKLTKPNIIQITNLVKSFLSHGNYNKAIGLVEKIKNIQMDEVVFLVLISYCTEKKLIKEGINIHKNLIPNNVINSLKVNTSLMNFYTKCEMPNESLKIFEKMKQEKKPINVITWNCALQSLSKRPHEAISLFKEMEYNNIIPTDITLNIILSICAEHKLKDDGLSIQKRIKELNRQSLVLDNALMNFYTKCEMPDEALKIFEKLKQEKKPMDVITWTCALQSLSKRPHEAISLFKEMEYNNIIPTDITLTIMLSICAEHKLKGDGLSIQKRIKELNRQSLVLDNALMNFYTKCEMPDEALKIFEKLKQEKKPMDVITWTCAIQALISINNIRGFENLLIDLLQSETCDDVLLCTFLQICAEHKLKDAGLSIQKRIKELNRQSLVLDNALMNFYTKCEMPDEALKIFEKLRQEKKPINVITWNCALQSLSKRPHEAISLFKEMEYNNIIPTDITLNIILSICDKWSLIDEILIVRNILDTKGANEKLYSTIMNIYYKKGRYDLALEIFEKLKQEKKSLDVITWTCALQSLSKRPHEAISLFKEMEYNNIIPTDITLTIMLSICAEHKLKGDGLSIQKRIKELNRQSLVLDNALMNFYTKCEMPDKALDIFEKLKQEKKPMDVITWTCAIQALVEMKRIDEALDLLKTSEIQTDKVIYVILLTACANSVSIEKGEFIIKLIESANSKDSVVYGAIINFYAKIGNISKARQLFQEYNGPPESVLWSVMIDAYAKHGMGKEALDLFDEMLNNRLQPVMETISSVLMACSHTGMVDRAKKIYSSILDTHIWCPQLRTSMIDVLARSGLLFEAEQMIGDSENIIDWTTILGACRVFNDLERAERVFNILINMDSKQGSYYVIMSHIYVQNGDFEKANNIRELMKKNYAKKIPGITTVEINGETHNFYSDDAKHPKKEEIDKELDKLLEEMKQAGYQPDTKWVTRTDVSDEESKKQLLCRHSEKIALAFAFISLPPGAPILMRKNLRMCGDCHTATKFISQIRKCDITVRDASRYHHFKDGKCSCGDFF